MAPFPWTLPMPAPNKAPVHAALARSLGIEARVSKAPTHRLPTPGAAPSASPVRSTDEPVPSGWRFWALALVGSFVAMGDSLSRGLGPMRFLWEHRVVIMRGITLLVLPLLGVVTLMARVPELMASHPLDSVAGAGFWLLLYGASMAAYALIVRWGHLLAAALGRRTQEWARLGARTVGRRQP
jgi:hypothetical protein